MFEDSMETLSAMPEGGIRYGEPPQGGPPMAPPPEAAGSGGPGIDTPQEQQAVELLMQAGQLMRQAAETDPGIGHIINKTLQDTFLQIADFYGFGEDAKMALKQATMQRNRERMTHFGPPGAGAGAGAAQTPFNIQY